MAKFRKKPVEVEAMRLTAETWTEVLEWCGERLGGEAWVYRRSVLGEPHTVSLVVQCEEPSSSMFLERATAREGDWVVWDTETREFSTCKPDIFEATYEPVEPSEAARAALEQTVAHAPDSDPPGE